MNISNNKKIKLNCDISNRDSEMAGTSTSNYIPPRPTAAQMLINETELFSNWHERQITKSINDNSINRVLDSYLRIFHEVNTLNLQTILPGGSVSSSPGRSNRSSNRFEESAILMAISEHGLQQNAVDSSSDECTSTGNTREPPALSTIELSSTPLPETSSLRLPSTISQATSQYIESPSSSSSITANNFNDLGLATNEILINNPSSIESNEDIDFMEAAVAVAIQNKGLTPYSVSMSPTR